MYCNYAFYFGATADNADDLASLKDLEGCCGIKLFAGSSTGNLLVAEEDDIDKVFQNASKVVAVHSEDEAILKVNKKLIKQGDVHTHPCLEKCRVRNFIHKEDRKNCRKIQQKSSCSSYNNERGN
jgi:dihydroorotase